MDVLGVPHDLGNLNKILLDMIFNAIESGHGWESAFAIPCFPTLPAEISQVRPR